MLVKIKLSSGFYEFVDKKLLGEDGKVLLEVGENSTVRNVLDKLNIPEKKVKILLVNSRVTKLDNVLKDQDELFIYPAVAGG